MNKKLNISKANTLFQNLPSNNPQPINTDSLDLDLEQGS